MQIRYHCGIVFFLLFLSGTAPGGALASEASHVPPARHGAKLLGKVSVSGVSENPRPLKVFKNRKFCGPTVANETLLIAPGGGLANAVVTLTSTDRVITPPPGQAILDNQQCAFVPHVQVVPLGSELLMKNSDPILHTVHARLGKETLFNVGLPRWRQVTKRLDRTGVMRIDCDVLHTWMSAAIVVVRTPYFTISDANGNFALDGLAPGTYAFEVWHERLGLKNARVVLQENSAVALEVIFSSPGAAR